MGMLPFLIAAVAAGAVLLVTVGVAMSGGSGGTVASRLEKYASAGGMDRASREPAERQSAVVAGLARAIEGQDLAARLSTDIARADLKLKPAEFLVIWAMTPVAFVVIAFICGFIFPAFRNPIALVVFFVLGAFAPRWYLKRRQAKRLDNFNKQLPDTITLLANSLRAGSSFLQGMELVTRESGPPLATEFERVIREMSLGMSLTGALTNLVRRVASEDLELMVTAIIIQTQVGGNLATVLDAIAFTIRERVRITGEIQTLTAMQRYSGYVLMLLPVALGGILFLISPSYMGRMLDKPPAMLGLPLGVFFFAVGGLSMFGGYLLIRRIIDIKV
ncbi:MAG: type II secretion system F family protein [Chloroflexota bacterium]|nr:type II secretion system F family protein [Chloroflexota bacterium]